MTKNAKKIYFPKVTIEKGSTLFWDVIKHFFTNKSVITNKNII